MDDKEQIKLYAEYLDRPWMDAETLTAKDWATIKIRASEELRNPKWKGDQTKALIEAFIQLVNEGTWAIDIEQDGLTFT